MTSGVHVLEDGSTSILSEHLLDLVLDIEAFSVGYTVGCLHWCGIAGVDAIGPSRCSAYGLMGL